MDIFTSHYLSLAKQIKLKEDSFLMLQAVYLSLKENEQMDYFLSHFEDL